MGNVSTNVCAKFRCAPLCIKKALGIFGPGRTDSTTNNNENWEQLEWLLGPAFRVQKAVQDLLLGTTTPFSAVYL